MAPKEGESIFMLGKFWRVLLKNADRIRGRRAIRKGLFQKVNWEAVTLLHKQYEDHHCGKYYKKLDHSLVRNAARIYALGLQKKPAKTILDVGCGFGYFMYAAEQFGHQAMGLDVPDPYLNGVTQALGLRTVAHRIMPFEPLPESLGGPFSLITAFATYFDLAGTPDQWGLDKWQFFMKDLTRFMTPDCTVYIKFNQYQNAGGSALPEDLMTYFRSVGGQFDKRAMKILSAPSRLKAPLALSRQPG
jgi:hypothetical protein